MKNDNSTEILNDLIKDNTISDKAFRLMCLILMQAKLNQGYSPDKLETKALQELIKEGYIKLTEGLFAEDVIVEVVGATHDLKTNRLKYFDTLKIIWNENNRKGE